MTQPKNLAELRESKGLSQAKVANVLGMTQQGYSIIERGERGLKAKNIKKLADLFKVSSDLIVSLALSDNDRLLNQTGTDA